MVEERTRRTTAADVASKREQILNVAEIAFADAGFHGVSLREILRLADANVASGNYYFVSKQKLYHTVVEQTLAGVQTDRHARMDAIVAGAWSEFAPDPLTAVLDAYVGPHIAVCGTCSGACYGRIMARIGYEPQEVIASIFAELIAPTRKRWSALLRSSFPTADDEAFARGVAIIIAIMSSLPARFEHHLPRVEDDDDLRRMETELVSAARGALVALLGEPATPPDNAARPVGQ